MERMPLRATFRAAVSMVAILLAASAGTVQAAATQPVAGYIVVYRDSVADNQVDAQTDRLTSAYNFNSEFRYSHALKGFAANLDAQQVNALRRDPSVAFVSLDRPVHAVASVQLAAGELAPTGVRRIGAATTTTARQASVASVAIIDTGIDLSHPDLNAVNGTNCINPTAPAQDDNGHGTHVAGTVGARNNGSGVVGVAPDTRLLAVKVLDSTGSGSFASVICGIDWTTANATTFNIKVANMSLSGGGANDNNCGLTNADPMHTAICRSAAAGVTFVVAAGNAGLDFSGSVPAAYPEVLTVTAISDSDGAPGGLGGALACFPSERDDYYASFSNFATTTADSNHTIAGPGVCTFSTWLSGGYNTISGTSMATPHVTGSVALCLGEAGVNGPCAGSSPAQIIQKMRSDAAARAAANPTAGFVGDPSNPVTITGDNDVVFRPYFGFLVWAGTTTLPTPDFSLSVSPASQSVVAGASATYAVNITRIGGFTGAVSLSVAGLPAGATASFSPSSTTGTTSTLTLTTTTATPTGSYPFTITGTSGSLARTTSTTLVVTAPPLCVNGDGEC